MFRSEVLKVYEVCRLHVLDLWFESVKCKETAE